MSNLHIVSPLIMASRFGCIDEVNKLIKNGVDPSIPDIDGKKPVHAMMEFMEGNYSRGIFVPEELARLLIFPYRVNSLRIVTSDAEKSHLSTT